MALFADKFTCAHCGMTFSVHVDSARAPSKGCLLKFPCRDLACRHESEMPCASMPTAETIPPNSVRGRLIFPNDGYTGAE
jgi:hypothetical protein